jgi:NAD(P)-dependent dehydrogenase (short-subunit alcohol dehydrogenase family)
MTEQFLVGQVALVTGASRGIGAATAEALARCGAHVVLTARTTGALEEVEERIHAAGGTATIAPLDLAESDSIARLGCGDSERWEALDLLVLNAAMLGTLTPVPVIDGKEFSKLLTLNLLAQQAMIAAFDPMLRASKQGRLLALTSSVGRAPRAYWGCLWSVQGGAGDAGAELRRGDSQFRLAEGRDRRSRRHRHEDARRLSGEDQAI